MTIFVFHHMKKKKGYFSISAVSHMLDVHQQTIRMYEKLGLLYPKRSEGNTRMFSEDDIAVLEKIIHFTTELKVNLAGVEIILEMQKKIDEMQHKMNAIFIQSKEELAQERYILEKTATHAHQEIKNIENNNKKNVISKNNTGKD